ncbi:hypothetical protein E6C60_2560 [Paenibacillus algicola]|uniref:DUF4352 domain-containing protein n=1 Tax=Paenibacillus algicola TaxID=2565926 RepID=A0A4P8XKM4_9BACL|nr:DUF4352 domain-containing protein [Paenibacillus algicola]QCT03272.1 hypothetical protein E6C60_2560 [Paenibacillus algicola]
MNKVLKSGIMALIAVMMLSGCSEAQIEKVSSAEAETVEASAKNTTEKETLAKEEEPKEEAKQTEIFKIGDSVKFDDLVITLNSAEENKGGDFDTPQDGYVYQVLDITVENKGTEEASVSSILNTAMADGDGYSYDIGLVTFIKNQLDGAVPAGRKLRGQLAFEVPKDAESLEFIFKDTFSTGQAIWKVK